MSGHRSPEEAVVAEDSVPAQYVNVIAVSYSPSGESAVVVVEYNEPSAGEPYVVLCERTGDGWTTGSGGSGGGYSWIGTSEDGMLGVEVMWDPARPTIRWGVPRGSGGNAPPRPDHSDE